MTFSLDWRAHSETGLVRKNNQDSGYASPTMLVVADGMGGAAAGDIASAIAIREVQRADAHAEGEDLLTRLTGAVSRANDTIADLVAHDHSLDGMGTTVCGGMFSGTQLGLVHIGDSRGYLLRDGSLVRLTHDHSWVQSLIDEGRLTEDEASVHPHRSLVLRVLNGQSHHQPDTELLDLRLGDRLLFCSDGLCGFASDATIADALAEADLDVAMDELVRAAHHGGGADNITIVLADVVERDETLEAAAPLTVGAAVDTEVPDPSARPVASRDDTDGDAVERGPLGGRVRDRRTDDHEDERYRPTLGRRRRWVPLLVLGLVLAVVVTGLVAVTQWSRSQYFVGEDAGNVAILNGVPGQLAGQSLSRVRERTDIQVAGLPRYYRQQVTEGIPASSLEGARQTVVRLRSLAGSCGPGASATPTVTATPSPSPVSSSSTPGASSTTPAGPGTSVAPEASLSASPSAPANPGGDC